MYKEKIETKDLVLKKASMDDVYYAEGASE